MSSIARRREPTAARQVQPRQDQRMPNGPRSATNIAPRFNNNAGSQAIGRRRKRAVGETGAGQFGGGGFDYEAFNAWQDPSIGGQQPGPIQEGWGGFMNSNDSMLKTKMNNYLNQFSTGGAREQQMNGLGYFNGGNAFTPRGRVNPSQSWMNESMENVSPDSTYQVMSPGGRGYAGVVTGGQGQQSQWTSFAPPQTGGGGGGTPRRNPRGQNSPGGMPIVRQAFGGGGQRNGGGRPGGNQQGGGGGGGGGNNGGRRGNQNGNGRPGYPGAGTPGTLGGYANIPAPQSPAQNFLPMTPQFEAGRRGLADEQMSQQTDILAQQALVDPLYQQQKARLETDRDYDVERMKEQLAGRGVFTPYGAGGQQAGSVMGNPLSTGGGVGEYLGTRDIQIPYGRQFSDLGTNAFNQYGGYNNQYGDTELAYNQGMAELLLGRAADAAEMMPMNVPQYSNGNRILRGQGYNNRPNKPNKNRGRRNRGRNK